MLDAESLKPSLANLKTKQGWDLVSGMIGMPGYQEYFEILKKNTDVILKPLSKTFENSRKSDVTRDLQKSKYFYLQEKEKKKLVNHHQVRHILLPDKN